MWDATQKVRIQQDNTNPPPVKDARINNDLGRVNMATCGWDVALVEQNANSPDCNTLGLAFLTIPINSTCQMPSTSIEQLIIVNVQAA